VVGLQTGAAFLGLGLVLEYLAHQVLQAASPNCPIPVQLTEVETTRGQHGREIVCLDLSEYGDPLSTRIVRIPFSIYHKPQQRREVLGSHVVDELPPFFLIPLFKMDEEQGLRTMHDPVQVAELARDASVAIPNQSEGTERLIEAYTASPLAVFHHWFYSQEHEAPAHWPESYDRLSLDSLPPCARQMLEQPNDALLKPVGIRHLTRVLLAMGWHPRHVAGLIRSKYERNFGWEDKFFHYDAATRADFYTRLFAGQLALGLDGLEDFCCEDLRILGFCPERECDHSLTRLRESLTQRTHHERLAGRSLNGLFL